MEILNFISNIVPLSTSYIGDSDVKFIGRLDSTEEGFVFFRENYLNNPVDRKINNYSCLYLTDKQKITNFIKIDQLPQSIEKFKFNSSIVDNNTGLYFTLSSSIVDISYKDIKFTTKDEKFVDPSDRIFEITIFNGCSAEICHKSKNGNYYYLSIEELAINFSLVNEPNKTLLNCILDKENNKLSLFKTINNTKYLIYLQNNIFIFKNFIR